MARDITDERLLGARHLQAMGRDAFDRTRLAEHEAFQAGTLAALMQGRFDGDATIGEVPTQGDHGIGTIEHLAGELVVVPGQAIVLDGDGRVATVPPETPTPFAVVCRFSPGAHAEVTEHQTMWTMAAAWGTVFGSRFPDASAGVDVPGRHAHFLSDDRSEGGQVLDLIMLDGHLAVDGGDDLHVELPGGVGLGVPGVADRAAIRAVEGGSGGSTGPGP